MQILIKNIVKSTDMDLVSITTAVKHEKHLTKKNFTFLLKP